MIFYKKYELLSNESLKNGKYYSSIKTISLSSHQKENVICEF